jgi:hypothetical protein
MPADAVTPTPADAPVTRSAGARRAVVILPITGLLLAAVSSALCLSVAGPQHGVVFGACASVVILTPGLIAGTDRSLAKSLFVAAAVSIGALVGPTLAFAGGELNTRTFLPACLVVAALTLAAAGLVLLLAAVRVPPAVAAWVTILLLLTWLSWPIWLSPWLAGREWLVDVLSPAHPLLALDAALTRENAGPWIQRPLMYSRLTVLGQHVFPRPPEHAGWAALLHMAIALPGGLLAWRRQCRNSRQASAPRED